MTTAAEREQRPTALFTDALAGHDGTAEPLMPMMAVEAFDDPLGDPRPNATGARRSKPGADAAAWPDTAAPVSAVPLPAPWTTPPSGARPGSRISRPPARRPAAQVRNPAMQFAPPTGPAFGSSSGARLPAARMPGPVGMPPPAPRVLAPAAPPQAYRQAPPPGRPAGYSATTPSAVGPSRGGPYPGPRPPGNRSDAAAIMQAFRAQARQRVGSGQRPRSVPIKKSSGIWGLLVVLLILGFSTGLFQTIIGAIYDLWHR